MIDKIEEWQINEYINIIVTDMMKLSLKISVKAGSYSLTLSYKQCCRSVTSKMWIRIYIQIFKIEDFDFKGGGALPQVRVTNFDK